MGHEKSIARNVGKKTKKKTNEKGTRPGEAVVVELIQQRRPYSCRNVYWSLPFVCNSSNKGIKTVHSSAVKQIDKSKTTWSCETRVAKRTNNLGGEFSLGSVEDP